MQGPSHLIISWFVAEASGIESPRERRIVALSGLAPDIDVLAYIGAIVYFDFDKDLAFEHVWEVVHHRYTHGLGFVLLSGIVAYMIASRYSFLRAQRDNDGGVAQYKRLGRVALLSMLVSAIHVFFDIVAGGATWPVYPLWPLSDFAWTVDWSWTLAEWPNSAILFACLAGMMLYARVAGLSPMESINYDFENWFVGIIEHGSDSPPQSSGVPKNREAGTSKALRVRVLIYVILILLTLTILAPLGFQLDQLNLPAFK